MQSIAKHCFGLCNPKFKILNLRCLNLKLIPGSTISSKQFHTSTSRRNWNKIFYQSSRKGADYEEKEQPTPEYQTEMPHEEFKSAVLTEVKKWRDEMTEKFEADPLLIRPGDTDKIFEFNTTECLKKFIVTSDSDWKEGNSNATLTLSPTGHGLFSGFIDKTVPKDGVVTNAGYCNMTSVDPTRSFKRKILLDWNPYTHLVMRIRGDGRRYMLVLNTSGEYDITWQDRFIYVLFTRGGPYWQDVKIPFSKFVFSAMGRTQDKQFPIPLNMIRTLGITAVDRITNDFRLEIDFIGLHLDPIHTEEFAYEMYNCPAYSSLA